MTQQDSKVTWRLRNLEIKLHSHNIPSVLIKQKVESLEEKNQEDVKKTVKLQLEK